MATRTVDLRSDSVTKPTEAMKAAMVAAEVDDDVLGTDPTAFRLELEVARMLGKEAGLFVPSTTMSNLVSVLVHCDIRGSEAILGDSSHIHIYENGGISTIGGVHPRPVKNNEDGTMDIDLIEAAIRDPRGELVYPTTRLICLESPHGNTGGRCLPMEYIDRVGELAKKHGLKLHIDGARIFNASVALGVPLDRLVQAADSVSACLSKGVGAPVGTVIVGSKTFISKARRLRKTLGGGMRQLGFICAAALVALQENLGKLENDHKNAKFLAGKTIGFLDYIHPILRSGFSKSRNYLYRCSPSLNVPIIHRLCAGLFMVSEGLNQIKGLRVNVAAVQTNIVIFDIVERSELTAEKLSKLLAEHGVFVMQRGPSRMRMVLHHQISSSDVQYTLSCFQQVFRGLQEENGY